MEIKEKINIRGEKIIKRIKKVIKGS